MNSENSKVQYDIYSIINLVNNKIYIGQSKQGYRRRFIQHLCPHSSCPLLNKAIQKYGKGNFECELLDIAYDQETANLKEKMWIKLLKTYEIENGYNLSMGGQIGSFNKETLKKMSDSKIGNKNSFYGKKHSEVAKEKMRKWKKANYQLGKHPQAKPIMCVETGKEYDCVMSASIETGINKTHIAESAHNADKEKGRKKAGGYHWIWILKKKK